MPRRDAGRFTDKKIGLRLTCVISAVLSCLGFILASTMGSSIAMLYVSYGVLSGIGIGIAYNAIISTVSVWFADKKGLCSGVLMMGFGASALVLGNAADAIIYNPDLGWRAAFRIFDIALGAVIFLAGIILKRLEAVTNAVQADEAGKDKASYTSREMLKSSTFYKAFILIAFLAAVGNTVISMAKDLALSVGIAPSMATTLVGILSLCNGLGRVITGSLFDKLGRRTTMIGANIGVICAAGITLITLLSGSPALCVLGLCLTGLTYGTCPTITSAFASEVFGPQYFAINFPIINCNVLFASFIATCASLINIAIGGYYGAFILLFVLSLIAMGLNLSLKK